MKSTFARQLQRYYTRKGSRIVFLNGMTLNQLSLEMWERLDFKDVDASVVSRVLSGERLFTPRQLEVFCSLLKLPKSRENLLMESLSLDLLRRFGFDLEYYKNRNKHLILFFQKAIEEIKEVSRKGPVDVSSSWAQQLHSLIKEDLDFQIDNRIRSRSLTLLSDLLQERHRILMKEKQSKNLYRPTIKLSTELNDIGLEIRESEYVGISQAMLGNYYYSTGKYKTAVDIYNKALKTIKDWWWRSTSLRILCICYGFLDKELEFERVKKDLIKISETQSRDVQSSHLEGIARAEALLGKSRESNGSLQKAWDLLGGAEVGSEYKIYGKIMLIRTELEVNNILQSRAGKNYLETLGREGIVTAQQFGYKRYEKIITKSLNEILN